MQLRNGKRTINIDTERMFENRRNVNRSTIPLNSSVQEFEEIFMSNGYHTLNSLRTLKQNNNKTDTQYLAMLKGFARIYNCSGNSGNSGNLRFPEPLPSIKL